MRNYIKLIVLLMVTVIMMGTVVSASTTSDLYIAEYDNGQVNVTCYVDPSYAGKPTMVSLRHKSENSIMPLYFNDTIIGQDGKINISFLYDIENVNEYFIRLNVASEYVQDVPISGGEIVFENDLISQFVYDADGEWYPLDYDTYETLRGTTVTIGAAIPEKFQDDCIVLFVTKDSGNKLASIVGGEAYGVNQYKASVLIPSNGTVEIYCWDSFGRIYPSCEKVTLPDDCMQTVFLTENPEPIAENPGKGWVRYRSDYQETEDVLQYVSVGYNRFNWNQVEPEEGVYDWSVIDTFINKWDALGKKAAFGIACASSTNSASYLTPKWVFDAGAAYTLANNGTQYVPVWNDPVFLAKLENFTKAFAQKYDGDSRIAFIDIRSYGNFGETHTSELTGSAGLSANEEKKHIDIATKYFKETQLMICTANTGEQGIKTEYAVNKGVGLRTDSVLSGNYGEIHKLDDAYGKEPTVFEFVNTYSNMKNAANEYGSNSNDNGHWNVDRYLLSFLVGKPSYMDLGQYNNDSQLFVNDNRELVEALTNKMGYHFVLQTAHIPQSISGGKQFSMETQFVNKGITPLYEDCYPAVALLDTNNRVIERYWLDSFEPKFWMPGEETVESADVVFSLMNANEVKLAIGFFQNKTDAAPAYQIGNYNKTDNNWYVLANGIKEDNGYVLTPVSQPAAVPVDTTIDDFYNNRMAAFYEIENSANIISDSTFESTGHNWHAVKNLSVVQKSTSNPHSGSYCGKITERSDLWSGAQIDITDLLQQNGAGTYRFEGWFRLSSGIGNRRITVYPFRINSGTEYTFTADVGSSWTKVTQDIEISQEQIDKLTHAVTLILGDDRGSFYNTRDIYFDDITLTKIN